MIVTAFIATKKIVEPTSEKYSQFLGFSQKEYDELSKRIMNILERRGMTTKEIKKALGSKLNLSPIVNLMCDKGLLIRGNPKGGWKSNIHTYFPFNKYFPELNFNKVDETKARALLVKQYLASFGPATENDIAWWTGFPKGQIKRIIRCLETEVTSFRIADIEANYLLSSLDRKSLMSVNLSKKPSICILPSLDPYVMGYKDRERYLNQEYYHFVFDRSGNATSTILLDGRIIGVWDFNEPFFKIFLFDNVKAVSLKKIFSIARKIGSFFSGKKVQIKQCNSMTSLTKRNAGGFMSPLRNC